MKCDRNPPQPRSREVHRPVSVPLKSFFQRSASSSTSISIRTLLRKNHAGADASACPQHVRKTSMRNAMETAPEAFAESALIPMPSRDGTITSAGSSHSTASKSSISLAWPAAHPAALAERFHSSVSQIWMRHPRNGSRKSAVPRAKSPNHSPPQCQRRS